MSWVKLFRAQFNFNGVDFKITMRMTGMAHGKGWRVINQQGIHHIDALFYLLGDPESLVGFEGNISNKLEAEDTFVGRNSS